jgi:MtN3 and saliva related transmembrane protein
MTSVDILGLIATCLTTASFVFQVVHTYKSRDVSGVSLPTYATITVGLALWIVYGVARDDMPLIVANCVMVCLTGAIMVMKIIYGKKST